MKKMILAFGIFTLVSLGGILIFAQRGDASKGFFGRGGFGPFGGRGLERIAAKLGLNDEQKTAIGVIIDETKTPVKPLTEAMRENRRQMEELGTDGRYDAARVEQLAAAQADLLRQLSIEKEKAKAAVFAVLTPEQRAAAKEMKNLFREKMKNRIKERGFESEKEASNE